MKVKNSHLGFVEEFERNNKMNKAAFIFLCFAFLIVFPGFAQERKDIVFLFQNQDSSIYKEGNIYHLDGLHFKKSEDDELKPKEFHEIKTNIRSIDDFKKHEAKQKDYFYDRNYTYHLLIKQNDSIKDSLIQVKRMIIIEENEIED